MKRRGLVLIFWLILIFVSSFVVSQTYEEDKITGAIIVEVPESLFPYTSMISLLLVLVVLVGAMFALRE